MLRRMSWMRSEARVHQSHVNAGFGQVQFGQRVRWAPVPGSVGINERPAGRRRFRRNTGRSGCPSPARPPGRKDCRPLPNCLTWPAKSDEEMSAPAGGTPRKCALNCRLTRAIKLSGLSRRASANWSLGVFEQAFQGGEFGFGARLLQFDAPVIQDLRIIAGDPQRIRAASGSPSGSSSPFPQRGQRFLFHRCQ